MEEGLTDISQTIREIMLKHGFNVTDVARNVNYSREYVSSVVNGSRVPSNKFIVKVKRLAQFEGLKPTLPTDGEFQGSTNQQVELSEPLSEYGSKEKLLGSISQKDIIQEIRHHLNTLEKQDTILSQSVTCDTLITLSNYLKEVTLRSSNH